MGPYTGEDHAKRGLVVLEPHLMRAYVDPVVCLAERSDLGEGRKKRARVLEEYDVTGPIAAMPMRSV